jgi:hypothetical protein
MGRWGMVLLLGTSLVRYVFAVASFTTTYSILKPVVVEWRNFVGIGGSQILF